ncbi:MAG: T9SS type A sorting domain-containing protein [Salinivirgaceae bacterium]|nr:T9SS type A sorting domain-containing protein [Salinivirgaceae bacterium]
MKYINTLLLIFITKLVIAQTEPQWVNASPFPNNYNGIIKGMFLNANEGWIWQVSKYKANKLYYTNDGAETFSKIYELTDSANRFFWVQMLDNKTGYSSTGFSTIYGFLKTNDGGLNWTNIPIDTAFLNQFNFPYQGEYYFTDTLTGFTNRYIDGEGLALYKTINGGINWQKANIVGIEEAGLIPVELGYVTKFFFIDAMHGWALVSYAMGAGICLSTSDGGETWQVAHNHGTDFFGIDFISTQKGGIVGRSAYFSHVYLTEDNFLSLSYENQAWDYEMQQYAYTIAYQTDSTIWISGTPGTFYRSIDNGYSFQEFESYLLNNIDAIFDIQFFKGNTGYAFGSDNYLGKYYDTSISINPKNKIEPEFTISPNPAYDKIKITFDKKLTGQIFIYTINGKNVMQKELKNVTTTWFSISLIDDGVYIIKCIDEHGNIYQQKFVKLN